MEQKDKIQKRVGEIAHSLLSEEYRIIVNVTLPSSYFIKLRHRFNTNCISVVGSYEKSIVRMFKNGRLIKEEPVS